MPTITTTYKGEMLFETKKGEHTITIDVPDTMGGKDRGPTPPQIFIASLGSCIGAFVAQYCENSGIDDSGMTVDLSFEKAEDPTRLVNLRAMIKLPKGECGRRVKAIEKVAGHCPVHATIQTMEELKMEIVGKDGCTMEG